MHSEQIVVVLYFVLAAAVVVLPLRWSLISYLLLTTVDFGQRSSHIGLLNAGKAFILPLYLFWRLRRYRGHGRLTLAPVAWLLLTLYAAVAALWSLYPALALKLTGHMLASFVICCVFLRATKGPELQPHSVLPIAIGVILIAAIRSFFVPNYGEEASRFTTFSSAQSFAALLVALYCVALCSRAWSAPLRVLLCLSLALALIFDGSRIWTAGLLTSSALAFLSSGVRSWIKICALGAAMIFTTLLISTAGPTMEFLSEHAGSNRIAAALLAVYRGDTTSEGLGTFRFRRGLTAVVVEQLEKSSPSQILFGHGTSNGAAIAPSRLQWLDPNRFFHNEWLRVIYDWGVFGLLLFTAFLASVALFALRASRGERASYAKPLLLYFPAFLLGLTGENIMAGAGNAVSAGFLLLIAFAAVAQRPSRPSIFPKQPSPSQYVRGLQRLRPEPALSSS